MYAHRLKGEVLQAKNGHPYMDGRSRSEANNNLVNMAHPYVCHQFKYANYLIGIVFYCFVIIGDVYSKKNSRKNAAKCSLLRV